MADDIKIDAASVLRRLAALRRHLEANAPLYGGARALQLAHGKHSDEGGDLAVPMVVSLQVRRGGAAAGAGAAAAATAVAIVTAVRGCLRAARAR